MKYAKNPMISSNVRNTTAVLSNVFNLDTVDRQTFFVSNGLDQDVVATFQYSPDKVTWYNITPTVTITKQTGQFFSEYSTPVLCAMSGFLRVSAVCSVAPTSGTLYAEMHQKQ